MDASFSLHLGSWLNALLREKSVQTSVEAAPCLIRAVELATMLSDYALETLGDDPRRCLDTCGLDRVLDHELMEATGFDAELLAVAFIGAVAELEPWLGEDGEAFLMQHGGMRHEDAVAFAHAAEVVSDNLAARGQSLLARLGHVAEAGLAAS